MKLFKPCFLLALLPTSTTAFSSIPANDPSFNRRVDSRNDDGSLNDNIEPFSAGATDSAPWRVALDIGREPLARMPFEWARSGCRMPLVFPCDFKSTSEKRNHSNNLLQPHSSTVSFTGPDGAVVKPIEGKEWRLSKDSKELTCCFAFPERLERRDVYIEAGTDLFLSARVYTQAELDQLNKEYYTAREELWVAGGELGDMYDRQAASKKWNTDTEQWEKRYPNENPLSFVGNQFKYWNAKRKQDDVMNRRPDLQTLSNRGCMPGVDVGIFVAKGGVVRAGKNGPVCGTWHAEPITGAAVSYRGN